jgi:hypothetical protein
MYSNKSIQVKDAAETDNALFIQDIYTGLLNQKFMLRESESAGFYKLIPLNSLKYVGIDNENVNSELIQSSVVSQETDWELIDESVAALDNVLKNPVDIYPNPVKEFISFSIDANSISRVEIIDIHGRVKLREISGSNRIDVEKLNPGIYFTKIWLNDVIVPLVSKFVKN